MNGITETLLTVAAVITALGGVAVAAIKVYGNTQKELNSLPKAIKKQSTIDMLITQRLEELKELLNADRVQIYDFHNGGHYANGRSALKTTCTYEVVRSGVQPKQKILQAIPLSCIPRFTNRLLESGFIEVKNIEEIKDAMPAAYELKREMGINSFYDIILNNKYGEPIGFLAVQYTTNKYHISREEDKKDVLKTKFFIEEYLNQMLSK